MSVPIRFDTPSTFLEPTPDPASHHPASLAINTNHPPATPAQL